MIDDIDVEALVKHFKTCDRKTQTEILDGTFHSMLKHQNLHYLLTGIYIQPKTEKNR